MDEYISLVVPDVYQQAKTCKIDLARGCMASMKVLLSDWFIDRNALLDSLIMNTHDKGFLVKIFTAMLKIYSADFMKSTDFQRFLKSVRNKKGLLIVREAEQLPTLKCLCIFYTDTIQSLSVLDYFHVPIQIPDDLPLVEEITKLDSEVEQLYRQQK